MNSWYPPPSKPRAVDGGIKARSTRGDIAKTWWSQRFISSLEAMGVQGRLARGKNYARRGQVISLDITPGVINASVQGSRKRPYRVRISLPTFGKSEWGAVTEALGESAWFSAKLLAGEMPGDIEEVFIAQGVSLFPTSPRELSMDCSCPDWEVPCKHLAAVFYLLAEDFDTDPFLILAWRGREREELLDALAAERTGTVAADRDEPTGGAVPLADCMEVFWQAAAPLPQRPVLTPAPVDALLDQVPDAGVRVRKTDLVEALRPLYRTLSEDTPEAAQIED